MSPDFTNSHRMAIAAMAIISLLTAYGMYLELDGMGMALGVAVGALAGIPVSYTHSTNKRETESEKK